MIVSYILQKNHIYDNNLQYFLTYAITKGLHVANTIIKGKVKGKVKGSLEDAIRYYDVDSDAINSIENLHLAISGKIIYLHRIVTGNDYPSVECTDGDVNQAGTFFNTYPLNTPIPIAITRQTDIQVMRSGLGGYWGIDDWGCLIITCEDEYMIRWIGSFQSDNIKIVHGISEPMPLQEFYNYMDEYGNFKVLESDMLNPMFENFVKHFILREDNYIGKNYEKSLKKELNVWVTSARIGNFFKMIAFSTSSGEFDDVIQTLVNDENIREISKHIIPLGKGIRKTRKKTRRTRL
jgi:hypothetical protein